MLLSYDGDGVRVWQHALFLPVLVCHLRFHKSLDILETAIDYKFQNRSLLQLALTHPSYRSVWPPPVNGIGEAAVFSGRVGLHMVYSDCRVTRCGCQLDPQQ